MTRPKWTAALLLLAVFVAGAGTGVGIMAWSGRCAPPPATGSRKDNYLEMLTRTLVLTPAQRDSVNVVLTRYTPAMDSLWQEINPRLDTVRMTVRAAIRVHLNPEQLKAYEEFTRRRDAERKAGLRGPR